MAEPEVYAHMGNAALLIYVIEPNPIGKKTPELWKRCADAGVSHLAGIKIGIPGTPGAKGAEITYQLNTVALKKHREQFEMQFRISKEDEADIDE